MIKSDGQTREVNLNMVEMTVALRVIGVDDTKGRREDVFKQFQNNNDPLKN